MNSLLLWLSKCKDIYIYIHIHQHFSGIQVVSHLTDRTNKGELMKLLFNFTSTFFILYYLFLWKPRVQPICRTENLFRRRMWRGDNQTSWSDFTVCWRHDNKVISTTRHSRQSNSSTAATSSFEFLWDSTGKTVSLAELHILKAGSGKINERDFSPLSRKVRPLLRRLTARLLSACEWCTFPFLTEVRMQQKW